MGRLSACPWSRVMRAVRSAWHDARQLANVVCLRVSTLLGAEKTGPRRKP